MTIGKDLHLYSETELKSWAKKKKIVPGHVLGTKDGIELVQEGGTDRIEPIDWKPFFDTMNRKGLAVYGTDEGWMKIMRKK